MLIRPVALKVLKPHAASDEMLARFEREVQLTSQLEHPCTIEIFDYGRTRDGIFYCAMELLDGFSVGELVERHGPQPPGRVAHLLRQVCGSLAEAHAKGMVHRDIKPQNIMVCTRAGLRDAVKLLDFGLVKNLAAHATRDLTRNLRILGTPLYMAPERINDPARVDARADLYALAAVAFLMLTGRRVFEADNDEDLIRQVLHAAPPRAAALAPEDVPAMLDALIARCLAKDPAQRPASVAEFDAVLAAVLGERPWTRRQIDAWWARQRSEPAPATTVQARE
jgi:serine/threonine-protein kinase